jgi:hypothetical protein
MGLIKNQSSIDEHIKNKIESEEIINNYLLEKINRNNFYAITINDHFEKNLPNL